MALRCAAVRQSGSVATPHEEAGAPLDLTRRAAVPRNRRMIWRASSRLPATVGAVPRLPACGAGVAGRHAAEAAVRGRHHSAVPPGQAGRTPQSTGSSGIL